MRGELGQKALGAVFGGSAKEHGFELQPTADGFFENPHAFDGAISLACKLSLGEGCPQLFDQGIMASLDASQAVVDGRLVIGNFLQGSSGEMIRVYLSLQC